MNDTFLFHVSCGGAAIDKTGAIIRGMSLITGGIEAEGHNLHVDETTLNQIHAWAVKRKKITVKADHKGADGKTFKAIVGYLENFRIEGTKVRGDLHLLHSEPLTPKILEMGERMPENFGLSVAFKGSGEKVKGKQFARCDKLISCDLVEQPAANPDGAFSAQVDTPAIRMPDSINPNPQATGTDDAPAWAKQLMTSVQTLTEKVTQQQGQIDQLVQGASEPDLAELANMTDEEVEAAGYDVEKVRAAVDAAIASGELTQEGGDPTGGASPNAAPGTTGGAPATGAGAGAPASAGTPATAMSAREVQRLINLEIGKIRKQSREAAEQAEAETAFAAIETKVEELATKNKDLTELNARQAAEIASLKQTLRTAGVAAVAPGVEGITLFTAKGAPAGSFEALVAAKVTELKASSGGKLSDAAIRSQAVQFCIRANTTAYAEYRARNGKIELHAK
jgi:hypothetical protein